MSKTYKHQYLYDRKHWENPEVPDVVETKRKFYYWKPVENGLPEYVEQKHFRELPQRKNVNDPDYKYPQYSPMWMEVGPRRKHYAKQRNRQCRQKVKALLKKGQYTEAKYIKPADIAWDIW